MRTADPKPTLLRSVSGQAKFHSPNSCPKSDEHGPASRRPEGHPRHGNFAEYDSALCSQVVEAAKPWLRTASDIKVLHIDEGGGGGLRRAKQWFSKARLQATFRIVPLDGDPSSRPVSAATGADRLGMKAYKHNPFWDWLRGGLTTEVLEIADLPLMMVH